MRMIRRKFPEVWAWKISDKWFSGLPDIFLLHDGTAMFIELKTPTGKVSKIQEYTFNEIRKRGLEVVICRDRKEVEKCLVSLTKGI